MTLSRGFFRANRKLVEKQIVEDSLYNPHGYALELIGKTPMFLQGFDIAVVLGMLDLDFDRFVLHQRFATSRNICVSDCHGYVDVEGRRWYHNGVIENFQEYRVDSQNLTHCLDMEDAIITFAGAYANLILTLPDGSVHVGRAGNGGNLCKDAKGLNFSTNPFSAISLAVSAGEMYQIQPKKIKKVESRYKEERWFGDYLDESRYIIERNKL
jgi:hypothetical protein